MGNKKGTFPGRDRKESGCRGARDSSRLSLSCCTVRAHRFTSLHCKRPGSPLPSPTVQAERKMLQSQEVKFSVHRPKWLPRVKGCDGSPRTQGSWAIKEYISHPSRVLKARPRSCWKSLDQNHPWKCKVHLLILKQR